MINTNKSFLRIKKIYNSGNYNTHIEFSGGHWAELTYSELVEFIRKLEEQKDYLEKTIETNSANLIKRF